MTPLPCPFCGVVPTLRPHGIYCENEACPVQPEVDGMTGALEPADHLRRWNTRAPVSGSLDARVAALDELSRNAVLSTLEGLEE